MMLTKPTIVLLVASLFAFPTFAKTAGKKKIARSPAQYRPCPGTDEASNTAWRDELIAFTLRGEYDFVRRNMERCFGENPDNHPLCTQDLYDYVNQKTYNFKDSEKEEAGSKVMTMMSEKDLPPEFLVRNKKTGEIVPGVVNIPENIHAIAKQKGWYSLTYRTRSTGGFDVAPNLTIIAIPNVNNRNFDAYLQISPAPVVGDDLLESNVSPLVVSPHKGQNHLTIITVDKSKNPPEGDNRIMDRVTGDPNVDGYKWNNTSKATSCMGCHTNPVRPISPRGYSEVNVFGSRKETFLTKESSATVDAINEMMTVPRLSWQRPWVNRVSVDGRQKRVRVRLGPPMDSQPYGWAPANSPTRSDDFIKQCIQAADFPNYNGFGNYTLKFQKEADILNSVRINYVKSAMNCISCHNNVTRRGLLHSDFHQSEMQFKIVADRRMPPWDGDFMDDGYTPDVLTPAERQVLFTCLKREYRDPGHQTAWKNSGWWLKRERCLESTNRLPSSVEIKNQTGASNNKKK